MIGKIFGQVNQEIQVVEMFQETKDKVDEFLEEQKLQQSKLYLKQEQD